MLLPVVSIMVWLARRPLMPVKSERSMGSPRMVRSVSGVGVVGGAGRGVLDPRPIGSARLVDGGDLGELDPAGCGAGSGAGRDLQDRLGGGAAAEGGAADRAR